MARQIDQKVEETPKTVKETRLSTKENYFNTAQGRGWLYGAGAFLILMVVFILGMSVNAHRRPVYKQGMMTAGLMAPGGERGIRTHGMFGDSIDATSGTRLHGVVTAVNGSTFTVAGNGATKEVSTNSSTQFSGGDQVKVNDSVLVAGTNNNGTFTATQVVINP